MMVVICVESSNVAMAGVSLGVGGLRKGSSSVNRWCRSCFKERFDVTVPASSNSSRLLSFWLGSFLPDVQLQGKSVVMLLCQRSNLAYE